MSDKIVWFRSGFAYQTIFMLQILGKELSDKFCPGKGDHNTKKIVWQVLLEDLGFRYEMNFSIEKGVFDPSPSLAAVLQGPGLTFSSENEKFKTRMNISSENFFLVRGGMFFLCAFERECCCDLWALWVCDILCPTLQDIISQGHDMVEAILLEKGKAYYTHRDHQELTEDGASLWAQLIVTHRIWPDPKEVDLWGWDGGTIWVQIWRIVFFRCARSCRSSQNYYRQPYYSWEFISRKVPLPLPSWNSDELPLPLPSWPPQSPLHFHWLPITV